MSKGYFVTALSSLSGCYIKNAYCLALSLLLTQKKINKLSVMTDDINNISAKYKEVFDNIIELPEPDLSLGSNWRVQNFYQLYYATPYEETVVLDADMLFFDDVSQWWSSFENCDVIVTNKILDYRGNEITYNPLRDYMYKHDLPDIHNGFLYFNKSDISQELFSRIKLNTINWKRKCIDLFDEEIHYSSDGALQMSVKEMGTLLDFTLEQKIPTFVHMKTCMQGWENAFSKDWRKYIDHYFDNNMSLFIGEYQIKYPFHYHIREFATNELISKYEKILGI